MTCLISKIDYFQVLFMVQSIFIRLGEGKKVTAILRRWSSRGLGTPEVNIASVTVPAFTAKKMASSKKKKENCSLIGQNPLKLLQIGAWRKPTSNTRPRGHLTWKKSHYIHDPSISFQVSVLELKATRYFALLAEKLFHKKKHFVIPLCFQKTRQWERNDQEVKVERTNQYRST